MAKLQPAMRQPAKLHPVMREPSFWWRAAGIEACLLAPAAAIYGAVAASRLKRQGHRAGVPVLCIGNPTVGGAGKTPTALLVARMLAATGERPVFLSRGYGGRARGPQLVDPERDRAADVGDEPLLLAREAPTVIARDRAAGAKTAVEAGGSVIVMDDGFQNPSLAKDFSVLVVDGRRGLGNARVFPAGPLRAPLGAQLERADAVVLVGTLGDAARPVVAAAEARKCPVFRARLAPDRDAIAAFAGKRMLAFAGIGDPEKVFATLQEAGVAVAVTKAFADHHRYTPAEAQSLCRQADADGLVLVTTEKDWARLQGEPAMAELAARVRVLPVNLVIEEEAAWGRLLAERMAAARPI
jgi:tetraacyldisaccharide 4'-kinase